MNNVRIVLKSRVCEIFVDPSLLLFLFPHPLTTCHLLTIEKDNLHNPRRRQRREFRCRVLDLDSHRRKVGYVKGLFLK